MPTHLSKCLFSLLVCSPNLFPPTWLQLATGLRQSVYCCPRYAVNRLKTVCNLWWIPSALNRIYFVISGNELDRECWDWCCDQLGHGFIDPALLPRNEQEWISQPAMCCNLCAVCYVLCTGCSVLCVLSRDEVHEKGSENDICEPITFDDPAKCR